MQSEAKKDWAGAAIGTDRLGALLSATAAGDAQAFRRLYDETSAMLFGLALRMLKRRDLAADVLQETYVSVWKRAARYDPARGTPMTWLVAILRYRAIDRLRQRRDHTAELSNELPDTGASPFEAAAVSEQGRRLRACLERLEEKQRTAITLAFLDGLTHEELAARIDSPVGTVKSWIRRGLLRLKECLGS